MPTTFRHASNGWTIRVNGDELRGEDGRVLRYDTKSGAQSAARLLEKPKAPPRVKTPVPRRKPATLKRSDR
ncbi:hypothetical protein LCGC14_1509650 [marine sediment metagenome]|uniref:DUF2188 domain-containing protein n=1 Tax=marine sediment metagenome TaxID=412755 RepID=A0A0F9LH64_9ZZZZ